MVFGAAAFNHHMRIRPGCMRGFVKDQPPYLCDLGCAKNSAPHASVALSLNPSSRRNPTFPGGEYGETSGARTNLNALAVSAHPDHHHRHRIRHSDQSLIQRQLLAADTKRPLAACSESHHGRQLKEQAVGHRAARFEQLRVKRECNLSSSNVLPQSHKSNLIGSTATTDPKTLFGSEPKCILEPEVTLGLYYVSGELLRKDIREQQAGVDLYTELQIVDVDTRKPVESLYIDFCHCNAMGVYSSIVANGNGDASDVANLNRTFSRGLAPTDADSAGFFRVAVQPLDPSAVPTWSE